VFEDGKEEGGKEWNVSYDLDFWFCKVQVG
jgi:hypothetical protein